MSAVLVVFKDKKQVARTEITGNSFSVGRSAECDLPIDESLASREHAEITRDGDSFWIKDCGSTNGTTLNGEKVTGRRRLNDGDEVAIGSTRLKFLCDAPAGGDGGPDDEATRAASAVDPRMERPGQKVKQKAAAGPLQAKLRITEGPARGAVFRDWEGPLTIGRALENNVVLTEDDLVSGHHAQVVQEGEQFYIQDLRSSNGTFLDGIKVAGRSRLANGQKIKVGKATLVFDLVDVRKQRRTLLISLGSVAAIVLIGVLVKLLQPPDVAGNLTQEGWSFYNAGELTKALQKAESALAVDSNRPEARQLMAEVKAEIIARELNAQAEAEARAGEYEKARELVYRVLRERPKDTKARELEGVIKSIDNTEVAIKAQNWTDALTLLEKARETYPNSDLISRRLDHARTEAGAAQGIAKAKDALRHEQLDIARGFLESVASNSVYYLQARQMLSGIDSSKIVAEALGKAQGQYRAGRLTEALTEIDAGLQASPESAKLREFRDRIRQMEVFVGPLKASEDATRRQGAGIEELLRARTVFADVRNLETDSLNDFHRRAKEGADRAVQLLKSQSQANIAAGAELVSRAGSLAGIQADALMLPQNIEKAKQLRQAWEMMNLAVKADESNQTAVQSANSIKNQVVAACREIYVRGLRLEELQQGSDAMKCFRAVVEIGIPGDRYLTQATAKVGSR